MSSPIRAFWWSPLRFPGLLRAELTENPRMWLELGWHARRTLTNFGDELNPMVLRYLSNRNVDWAKPVDASVVCIGSVLELFADCGGRDALVLGCGLRSPLSNSSESVRATLATYDYIAVRGPMTSQDLGLVDVCEADPGVLSDRLKFKRMVRESLGPIYIPHFRTWSNTEMRLELRVLEAQGVRVVAPSLSAEAVLSAISGASVVYSSSLHGLICSHSLGVPAVWVGLNLQGGREPTFKYDDYFRSISVSNSKPILISEIGKTGGNAMRDIAVSNVASLKERTERMAQALAEAGSDALR